MCKSAPRSRQITTPAHHHSSFLQAGCPSCRPTNSVKALKAQQSNQIKWFIRHGSNTCWIHRITIKYKYKLDNRKHKMKVKGTPVLTISNGN